MEKFSNELTDAQLERLAILSEELGEAQQVIGKIIRHGYESSNPIIVTGRTNRQELEKELGDIGAAVTLLLDAGDINVNSLLRWEKNKLKSVRKWLHHQE